MSRNLLPAVLIALLAVACVGSEEPSGTSEEPAGSAPPPTLGSGAPGGEGGAGDAGSEQAGSPTVDGADDSPDGEGEEAADSGGTPNLILVAGGRGEVRVMSPGGTVVRELRSPTPGGPGPQPTWSPVSTDGRRRAAWTELAEDGTFRIALAEVPAGDVERYESPVAPFFYYWSPDGAMLGFLGQNAFSPLQMGVLDLPTGELEMIGEGQPFYFDWRPDSGALVTHVNDAMAILTRVEGGWSRKVMPVAPGLFQAPAWVGQDRILLTTPRSAGAVEVSLAGTAAAQADLSGQRLVVADTAGRPVSTLAELEGPTAFAPDSGGRRVAFTDFPGPLQVTEMPQAEAVAVSQGRVAAFQWSPDGGRLLFLEVDSDAQTLVPRVWDGNDTLTFPAFFPTRVFLLQYLPFWDQYARSLTLWAPSGEAFTYPAATAGGDRIMLQRLDESQPRTVGRGVFASWPPTLP